LQQSGRARLPAVPLRKNFIYGTAESRALPSNGTKTT
jgi:hypothetical protein